MKILLTVAEVARLLRTLDGQPSPSPRAIRYYARTGMVQPTGRAAGPRGSRLYTIIDVALVRLVCQLRREAVHERAAWGLLVYKGAELRALVASGRGTILTKDARLLSVGQEHPKARPVAVDVAALLHGIETEALAYRALHPNVWTGAAWVPAGILAETMTRGAR